MNTTTTQGITLIEVTLAMAISLGLISAMTQFLIANKRSYRLQTELAQLQDNARFALEMVSDSIKLARYAHCEQIIDNLNNANQAHILQQLLTNRPLISGWSSPHEVLLQNEINIYQIKPIRASSTWINVADPLNTQLRGNNWVLPSSDILQIQRLDSVKHSLSSHQCLLDIDLYRCLKPLDTSEHHDDEANGSQTCVSLKSKHIGRKNSSQVNDALNSTAHFQKGVSMVQQFFISKLGNNASALPTLYTRYFYSDGSAGRRIALVEGVEAIHFTYGVDSDGDASINQYMSAKDIYSWESVRSVEVAILLASSDGVGRQNDISSYDLNGYVINPKNDLRIRHVAKTSISLWP